MIQIKKLSFEYGQKVVYDDFSLSIQDAGIYGLFGRNGSGKSTLLKLISGLLFAHGGTLSVLGHEPSRRAPDFLALVYIVPEEFHLPNITLAQLADSQSPFYPNFSKAHFEEYAGIFEIPTDKGFESMSLGQKKKAVISFALATHTPILLMDEPTNGLDILGRAQFKIIMARAEHASRVVLISTHQAHDLESLMSHVLFVDGGSLALAADMMTLQSALSMGVTDDIGQLSDVIYQEHLGQQVAYVAANHSGQALPIHLELLYKALSLQKEGVLKALNNFAGTTSTKGGTA
ncbi:ABC transporter ATP-binding protein [Formosimonas limnophila]|uniref:ABC transporter ATP-binding protein n=1 Tax=Formosimonas limnophila TaxID=1384487 RepID=A0A8J3G016_9BURK|nr:ABC transporter ATP-binding protein [Formosimonas limnophila]GHA64477.1 ABC transporter ATP-binding protein [Formosimonas limnophila]